MNTAVLFFFYRLLSTHLDFIPSDFLCESGSQDQFLEDYSTPLVSPNSISKVFEEKKKKWLAWNKVHIYFPSKRCRQGGRMSKWKWLSFQTTCQKSEKGGSFSFYLCFTHTENKKQIIAEFNFQCKVKRKLIWQSQLSL